MGVEEEVKIPKDAIVEQSIRDKDLISQLDHTFFGTNKSKAKGNLPESYQVVY
jgi:hypothetical protein